MKPASRIVGLSLVLTSAACCVTATTMVRTPDGEVPAGALAVGDRVTSIDVATGAAVIGTIARIRRARRECLALRWRGETLVCTPDHPLYSPERGTYRPASDWVTGDARTLLAHTGEVVEVIAVEVATPFAGMHEVVDLTLEDEPRNFVAAGIVVHNKSDYGQAGFAYTEVGKFGPPFTLTAEDSTRRFRVRACLSGTDLHIDEIYVSATAESPTVSDALRLRIEVGPPRLGEVPEEHVLGDPIGVGTYASDPSCSVGHLIVFKRVVDLPDEGIPIALTEWRATLDIDPGVLAFVEISLEEVE